MNSCQHKVVIFAIFVLFASVANAQKLCNVSVMGLMSCEPAAQLPKPTPPSKACCTALSQADMACLCTYKNSTTLPALGIDPALAMQLPEKCKLPHPAEC